MSKQLESHTIMNNKSSECYICDETWHFSHDCPVQLQALKDKKGLNSKGVPSAEEYGSPKNSPERSAESASPAK